MSKFIFLLSFLLLFSAVAAALSGCGSARRGAPVQDPVETVDPEVALGEQAFMQYCHSCHPGGEAGLGSALNNKPLPGSVIRFQVRNGVGAMPSFGSDVIDEDELNAIIAYLVTLRRHNEDDS